MGAMNAPEPSQLRDLRSIQGPLIFVEKVIEARMGEVVSIVFPDGHEVEGEVLRIERDTVLIQVIGDSRGLDMDHSRVVFTDVVKRAPLSLAVLNRTFGGSFQPLDDLPMFVPERWAAVSGLPLNPVARERPQEMIETGFSTIDGLNTLVKGQKLPIFSCAGLPSREIAAGILEHARARSDADTGQGAGSVVVFVALGLAHHEYAYYRQTLERVRSDFVAFINLAKDPVVERLLAPRYGLTVAEYLAFEQGRDVLVVITDMTNYCDALREVSTAREELPGGEGIQATCTRTSHRCMSALGASSSALGRSRCYGRHHAGGRHYPSNTGPDWVHHRGADRAQPRAASARHLSAGGRVAESVAAHAAGNRQGRTREDHRDLANALYMHYASGRDLRRLEAIVGREGMSDEDRRMLDFADAFEREIVHQGTARRGIDQTLDMSRALLERFGLLGS